MSEQQTYEKDLASLAEAIKENKTEQALDLIKKIPAEHLYYPDEENGRTHLHNAINLSRNDVSSALIRKEGVTAGQLLSPDKNGKTALDDAIRQNDTEQSLDLIKNIPAEHLFYPDDETGRTHLQNAINMKNNDIASALIRKKGVTARQLLSRDKNGKSALDIAISLEQGSLIMEILANKEIKYQIKNKHLEIALDKDWKTISQDIVPRETLVAAYKAVKKDIEKLKFQNFDGLLNNAEYIMQIRQSDKGRDKETEYLENQFKDPHSILKSRQARLPRLLIYQPERER